MAGLRSGHIFPGGGGGGGNHTTSGMGTSQYGAVGGEHSYAVTGVVNVGPYAVAVLCFRLRLIVSLYFVDGWLEERPHRPGGGGVEPYHIWYGDLSL